MDEGEADGMLLGVAFILVIIAFIVLPMIGSWLTS